MKYFPTHIHKLSLIFAILLGLFLYFYKLGQIPNGLYIDEASPGYNAYSVLKTGKDEYGKPLPILFRFQGLYAPPLYTYMTILPVCTLGLNVFSVRFVAALSGLLSTLVVYKFIKEIDIKISSWVLTFGSLIYLITPWLLFHSRNGYEASLGYFLFTLANLYLYKSLTEIKHLKYALLLLSLSTYASHPYRVLSPILGAAFLILFYKELQIFKNIKKVSMSVLGAIFIQIPYLLIINSNAFSIKRGLLNVGDHDFSYSIWNFFSQYFTYFSPRSLFFLPDPDPQRSIPDLSVFYVWTIIPFFVGLASLWKNKKLRSYKFIWLLLILTPIPASLVNDPFSTYRAMPLLLPITTIMFLGYQKVFKLSGQKIYIILSAVLIFVSGVNLYRSYFILLPVERAVDWDYGNEQLANEIMKNPEMNFVIDQSRKKPTYEHLLFFMKYSPSKFQEEMDFDVAKYYKDTSFDESINFSNVELRGINWQEDIYEDKILVGDDLAISDEQVEEHFLNKQYEIVAPNGEIVWVGYSTNPDEKCLADSKNIHCDN